MNKYVYGKNHGCASSLWGPFIWACSFSACIHELEYAVYRVDKGGSTESREGSRPDICIRDKSGEIEVNMSYDPADRKCFIGIENWQRLST